MTKSSSTRLALALASFTVAAGAAAHPAGAPASLLRRWTLDPFVIPPFVLFAIVYGVGVRRLWRHAGIGRGIRKAEAASFGVGLITAAVALLSPIDYYSDLLFAAHMTQHELLMVAAAPLVVIGRPFVAGSWALTARARVWLSGITHSPSVRVIVHFLTAPLFALALHALVRWIWHIPRLFEAAMRHEALHAVQHLSFFATASLFWWALVYGRYGKAGYGLGFLFVFATAVHTTVLGALIATAPALLYPIYRLRASSAGFDPHIDQELAGFVMWIPSGFVLAVGGLALFFVWLTESAHRAERARLRDSGAIFPGSSVSFAQLRDDAPRARACR
jgi:putative membrane protein